MGCTAWIVNTVLGAIARGKTVNTRYRDLASGARVGM